MTIFREKTEKKSNQINSLRHFRCVSFECIPRSITTVITRFNGNRMRKISIYDLSEINYRIL